MHLRDIFFKNLYYEFKRGNKNKFIIVTNDFGAPFLDTVKKDFPNYDNRVILDEEKLLSHVKENVADYNFENNNLSKKEFIVKFFGLLFAMISFVEMANVQNIDIKLFVIKAGKDFLKEKNFDDSEFYNYFDIIVYVLFNVINGSLSVIQNSNIKCNCNCFSFFFSK